MSRQRHMRVNERVGPILASVDQRDSYAAGYLAGLQLDDPEAHPWSNTNRVARRFQAKRIAAWRRGYDAGNAKRIRGESPNGAEGGPAA